MRQIDRRGWGQRLADLVDHARADDLPRVLPFGAPVEAARVALEALGPQDFASGRPIVDQPASVGLRSAVWLLHDFMTESHELAQQIEDTMAGPYWHAIVHRREPDPGNACYWFGRVGAHPIFPELLADAGALATDLRELHDLVEAPTWRADRFVELCTSRPPQSVERKLLAIQRREWELLFEHEWRRAFVA